MHRKMLVPELQERLNAAKNDKNSEWFNRYERIRSLDAQGVPRELMYLSDHRIRELVRECNALGVPILFAASEARTSPKTATIDCLLEEAGFPRLTFGHKVRYANWGMRRLKIAYQELVTAQKELAELPKDVVEKAYNEFRDGTLTEFVEFAKSYEEEKKLENERQKAKEKLESLRTDGYSYDSVYGPYRKHNLDNILCKGILSSCTLDKTRVKYWKAYLPQSAAEVDAYIDRVARAKEMLQGIPPTVLDAAKVVRYKEQWHPFSYIFQEHTWKLETYVMVATKLYEIVKAVGEHICLEGPTISEECRDRRYQPLILEINRNLAALSALLSQQDSKEIAVRAVQISKEHGIHLYDLLLQFGSRAKRVFLLDENIDIQDTESLHAAMGLLRAKGIFGVKAHFGKNGNYLSKGGIIYKAWTPELLKK